MMSEAMANRASLSRSTLYIYNEMIEIAARDGFKEAGGLAYKVVAALAAESGKPLPQTLEKILQVLREELKGFDTPEAKERADRARLDAVKDLLSGQDK
jgi:hypothetical protein